MQMQTGEEKKYTYFIKREKESQKNQSYCIHFNLLVNVPFVTSIMSNEMCL